MGRLAVLEMQEGRTTALSILQAARRPLLPSMRSCLLCLAKMDNLTDIGLFLARDSGMDNGTPWKRFGLVLNELLATGKSNNEISE